MLRGTPAHIWRESRSQTGVNDLSSDDLNTAIFASDRTPSSKALVFVEFVQQFATYDKPQAFVVHRVTECLARRSLFAAKGFGNHISVDDCAH